MFMAYMGLESLHRGIRDVADPKGRNFGDLDAHFQRYIDDPTGSARRLVLGATPLTGIHPLGGILEYATTGRPINLTGASSAGMENLVDLVKEGVDKTTLNGPQVAQEFINIFNTNDAR